MYCMTDSPVGFVLLGALLIAGLAAGTSLPRMHAYLLVTGVYAVVLSLCYIRGTLAVGYGRAVLYPTVALWVVFAVVLVLYPTERATLRAGAFIVFSAINLFVVPATFPREQFVDTLAIVAAAVAALAIPLAYPSLQAGQKGLGVWVLSHPLMGTDIATPVLTSIFWNPNYLSAVSAFGFVAVIGFARTRRRWWIAVVLGATCLIGLIASSGRAATLALAGAVVLYLAYLAGGTNATIPVVCTGIIGGVFLFILALGGVLGIDLPTSFFNNRQGLWEATINAIRDQPLLGYGLVDTPPILAEYGAPTPSGNTFGSHNSYLRMFLQTGLIGGVLYSLLCGGALVRSIGATRDGVAISGVLLSLLGVFFTLQLFNGSTLFGLSLISSFGALILGFSQHPDRRIEFRSLLQ